MKNLYMPELAVIEEIKDETPKSKTLSIALDKSEPMKIIPGQFIELTIFGSGEFPVSVSGVLDAEGNRFQTTIQQVGKATAETSKLSLGSKVGVRGPFGNGFPLETFRGKNICIITGGVGLAAVKYLANHILEDRDQYGEINLLHGAKTPSYLIFKELLFDKEKAEKQRINIHVTVDQPEDGWNGNVGMVTELLQKTEVPTENAVVVLCGPGVMMKFVSRALSEIGFSDEQILLSLENKMHCGIGLCGHCAIGPKKVCVDGAIFNYADVKNNVEKLF